MRYPIAIACALLMMSSFSSPAYAGDPEADRKVYEAFERHLSRLPEYKRAKACENFLEWYPDNIYAPEVRKKLAELTGEPVPEPQPLPPRSSSTDDNPGTNLSTFANRPPQVNAISEEEAAFAEAAEVVGSVEEEAADALGGAPAEEYVADPQIPEVSPAPLPRDVLPQEEELRRGRRFGIGTDFTLGALIGIPMLTLDYLASPRWTLGAAVRFPLVNMVELAFEPRFFLSPKTPYSAYVGMSISTLSGNVDAMISVLDPGGPDTNATAATKVGFLGGVQKITPRGHAFYLEGAYQSVAFSGANSGVARFPSLSVGYRFFFGD